MFKTWRFQTRLLIGLTVIIGALISMIAVGFYSYSSTMLTDKDERNAEQMAAQFSNQLETLLRQVDSAAIVLTTNGSLRKSVISLYNNSPVSSEKMLEYENEISKNLLPISYAFPFDFKTVLFNNDKNFYFASGVVVTEQDAINARLRDLDWYHHLIPAGQNMSISAPHPDEWSSNNPKPVISVYRRLMTEFFDDYATLEIQIPYKTLEKILNVGLAQPSDFLIVKDKNGNLIYPISLDDPAGSADVYRDIEGNQEQITHLPNPTGNIRLAGKPYLYASKQSAFSGWSVIYFSSQKEMFRSLNFYRNLIILGGFAVWLVVVSAVFLLIRRLTRSLKQLILNVRSVRLSNMSMGDYQGDHDEFRMLNEEFNKMFAKLKESIGEVYESRIREERARKMALQAQINPHFLYNTLNSISAAGEQYGSGMVTKMCNRLAGMMRYITSSGDSNVMLRDEISHVANYLELIAVPYEGQLIYNIDIPETMERISVPKLMIQPLVENSVNHGLENAAPPWHLSIKGETDGERWRIAIEDSGPGFDPGVLRNILRNLQECKERMVAGRYPDDLSVGGMGLMNVYMRLTILYKDKAFFHIENLETGGCRVTIGGTVETEENAA
jgi:two-component system sensor histidine kinase YesM